MGVKPGIVIYHFKVHNRKGNNDQKLVKHSLPFHGLPGKLINKEVFRTGRAAFAAVLELSLEFASPKVRVENVPVDNSMLREVGEGNLGFCLLAIVDHEVK